MKNAVLFLVILLFVSACTSDNEHFCARYNYLYKQLEDEKELPSYEEMKLGLEQKMIKPDSNQDQPKFMLFVLNDFHYEMKPTDENPQDYCMRVKRWAHYK